MSIEKVKIEIETLGSAFQEDEYSFSYEIARILKQLANRLENGGQPGYLMDINGNKVGSVEYIEE